MEERQQHRQQRVVTERQQQQRSMRFQHSRNSSVSSYASTMSSLSLDSALTTTFLATPGTGAPSGTPGSNGAGGGCDGGTRNNGDAVSSPRTPSWFVSDVDQQQQQQQARSESFASSTILLARSSPEIEQLMRSRIDSDSGFGAGGASRRRHHNNHHHNNNETLNANCGELSMSVYDHYERPGTTNPQQQQPQDDDHEDQQDEDENNMNTEDDQEVHGATKSNEKGDREQQQQHQRDERAATILARSSPEIEKLMLSRTGSDGTTADASGNGCGTAATATAGQNNSNNNNNNSSSTSCYFGEFAMSVYDICVDNDSDRFNALGDDDDDVNENVDSFVSADTRDQNVQEQGNDLPCTVVANEESLKRTVAHTDAEGGGSCRRRQGVDDPSFVREDTGDRNSSRRSSFQSIRSLMLEKQLRVGLPDDDEEQHNLQLLQEQGLLGSVVAVTTSPRTHHDVAFHDDESDHDYDHHLPTHDAAGRASSVADLYQPSLEASSSCCTSSFPLPLGPKATVDWLTMRKDGGEGGPGNGGIFMDTDPFVGAAAGSAASQQDVHGQSSASAPAFGHDVKRPTPIGRTARIHRQHRVQADRGCGFVPVESPRGDRGDPRPRADGAATPDLGGGRCSISSIVVGTADEPAFSCSSPGNCHPDPVRVSSSCRLGSGPDAASPGTSSLVMTQRQKKHDHRHSEISTLTVSSFCSPGSFAGTKRQDRDESFAPTNILEADRTASTSTTATEITNDGAWSFGDYWDMGFEAVIGGDENDSIMVSMAGMQLQRHRDPGPTGETPPATPKRFDKPRSPSSGSASSCTVPSGNSKSKMLRNESDICGAWDAIETARRSGGCAPDSRSNCENTPPRPSSSSHRRLRSQGKADDDVIHKAAATSRSCLRRPALSKATLHRRVSFDMLPSPSEIRYYDKAKRSSFYHSNPGNLTASGVAKPASVSRSSSDVLLGNDGKTHIRSTYIMKPKPRHRRSSTLIFIGQS